MSNNLTSPDDKCSETDPQTQEPTKLLRVMHLVLTLDVGGAEQVVRHIIEGVDSNKFQSSVVCIDGHDGEVGQLLRANGYLTQQLNRGPGFDLSTIIRLRRLIQEQRIDVLHCHQYSPFCYGAIACLGIRTKIIFTEHGRFYPDRYSWKRRVVNQILYRLTHRITCISKATRQALHEFEWIPASRVNVIYNGVATPSLTQPPGYVRDVLGIKETTFVVGTISRLDPIKNQHMMIRAFADLHESVEDCALILVGDGPEREALEEQAASSGVSDSVHFTGFVTNIADYLSAIDVFLLTSFSEGTSMTLLEAMSMKKAIIATAVGGNIEVLKSGETGMLIDSDDQQALRTELIALHKNNDWRDMLGHNAQTSYQSLFSRKTMTDAYSSLYQLLWSGK